MGAGLAGLTDQRERCIQVLRDLELDFETRKILEADYLTMKGQVSAELATILEQMDQAGSSSSPGSGVGDESVAR